MCVVCVYVNSVCGDGRCVYVDGVVAREGLYVWRVCVCVCVR